MEASSTADIAKVAPAGSIVCCSTKSGETSMVDIATGEVQVLPFSGSSIEISPDRKTLAYVDRREQLHVYYLDNGIDVRLSDPGDSPTATAAGPRGRPTGGISPSSPTWLSLRPRMWRSRRTPAPGSALPPIRR